MQGLKYFIVLVVFCGGLAGCDSSGAFSTNSQDIDVDAIVAVDIAVQQPTVNGFSRLTLAKGLQQPLVAIGIFDDNSTRDITGLVSWKVSDETIAKVSGSGTIQGLAVGSVDVFATFNGLTSQNTIIVTVTDSQLLSIQLVPPLVRNLTVGEAIGMKAIGSYSDGSTALLTDQVSWQVDSPSTTSIDQRGTLTAESAGRSIISASLGTLTADNVSTVDVTSAALTDIQVTPPRVLLNPHVQQQFTATGLFSDGTTTDLSERVSWVSADESVLSMVDGATAQALSEGQSSLVATLGDITSNTALAVVSDAALHRVQVSSERSETPVGTFVQLTALALFEDGSSSDFTQFANWVSSDPSVATVSESGFATAVEVGTVDFTATFEGESGSYDDFDVSAAVVSSIQVSPSSAPISVGEELQLSAMAIYTDGTRVDVSSRAAWAVVASESATIDNTGLLLGVAPGSVSVSAWLDGVSSNLSVVTIDQTVLESIRLVPATQQVPVGTLLPYQAIGVFSNNTTRDISALVSWHSQQTSVATVDPDGVSQAVSQGQTNIVATLDGVSSSSAVLNVSDAEVVSLQVTPTAISLPIGRQLQYQAIAMFTDGSRRDVSEQASWHSDDSGLAEVTGNGVALAKLEGQTAIHAFWEGVRNDDALLTVTPVSLRSIQVSPLVAEAPLGTTVQYQAFGIYSDDSTIDISDSVSWFVSDSAVAAIDSQGLLKSASLGTSTVVASLEGITNDDARLSVTDAVLNAIQLEPASFTTQIGSVVQYQAIGRYSDDTTRDISSLVTWHSDDTEIAAIDLQGQVTTLRAGSTAIHGMLDGIRNMDAMLTVSGTALVSIQVTPARSELPLGRSQQYQALGTYSDNTVADISSLVTWHSDDTTVATISLEGLATGVNVGSVAMHAMLSGVQNDDAILNVTSAELVSIAVTPQASDVPLGRDVQYRALGSYSDGSVLDISDTVSWVSSAPQIVTISATGVATGAAQGIAMISAGLDGVNSEQVSLQISSAVLRSITVSPDSESVAKGNVVTYRALGTYTDLSVIDLTTQVNWISQQTTVATISSLGQATGVTPGSTTIFASLDGVSSNSASLDVTAASLDSITISGSQTTLIDGYTLALAAEGTYSDGSTRDISAQVNWISSATQVATVSTSGVVTGESAGSTTLLASLDGVSSNTYTLTVTQATLESIAINTSASYAEVGTTISFAAEGTYSDGNILDITNLVFWSSSQSSVLTVDASGTARAVRSGLSDVSASLAGLSSNSITITVDALGVMNVGVGWSIEDGESCLTDGNKDTSYGTDCLAMSLSAGADNSWGFVAEDTYFDYNFGTPTALDTITFFGYWRLNRANALGTWRVLACTNPACSNLTPISGNFGLRTNEGIAITDPTPYQYIRFEYVSGPVSSLVGGSGAGVLREMEWTSP
ncbi:beta strand repeat-containing protein [Aliagarivorans taiwanensis]|uniref:beta strand repeat-containing protein n=1 Tax=Aliagarivorans taiwanensis TaxID=561966 RepID=UPI00146FC60C|nr:Ig-like domain-containing protein [Aliagarivorans taiwanensis]